MTEGKYVFVINLGSSAIRLALIDDKANLRWISSRDFKELTIQDDIYEYDAQQWLTLLEELMQEAKVWVTDLENVEAIILTAQRSSVVAVDEKGVPLYPVLAWQDRRHAMTCYHLEKDNPRVREITGAPIRYAYSGPKMVWLKERENKIYERSYKLMNPQEFLTFHLTGECKTDYTYASRSNLFDIHEKKWSAELLESFGISEDKLCEVVEPGSTLGIVKSEWSSQWGLPDGLPLISAGGDQQCAAIGLAVIRPGSYQLKADEGGYISAIGDKFIDNLQGVDTNLSAIPGYFNYELGMLVCGNGFDYLRNLFYPNTPSYQIAEILKDVPVGSNGVMIMPNFYKEKAFQLDGNRLMDILSLSAEVQAPDVLNSYLESVVCEFSEQINHISDKTNFPADRIVLEGSLSTLTPFTDILTSILSARVFRPASFEAAIYGAWINVAVISGHMDNYEDALGAVHQQIQAEAFANHDHAYGEYRRVVKNYQANKENKRKYLEENV